jgi:hypothetical protein
VAGRPLARRILLPLAWLVAAGSIAVGVAVLITTLDRPDAATRPELTSVADRAAGTALYDATAQLRTETDAVAGVEAAVKLALSLALAGDGTGVDAVLAQGNGRLAAADAASTAFDAALDAVPGMGPGRETRVAAGILARDDALAADRGLAKRLDTEWAAFTAHVGQVTTVADVLRRHDVETAAATTLGAAGHYAEAITALDKPAATLDEIRLLRDALAATGDAATLSTWIDEHAGYDIALRNLYAALVTSNGVVTDAVRAAGAAESTARARLPADTRMLTLILSDVASGGLNQRAAAIAAVHDALAAALDEQVRLAGASAPPG